MKNLMVALKIKFAGDLGEPTKNGPKAFDIFGIEISLDFYPVKLNGLEFSNEEERALQRVRMTEALRKHVNIVGALIDDEFDEPRYHFNDNTKKTESNDRLSNISVYGSK